MGKTPEVRRLDSPDHKARWDALVLAAGGNIFQTWEWWDLVERATGEPPLRLGVYENAEELVGVSVALDRKRLGWRVGVNPLLTPYAGVVLAPSERSKYRHIRHERKRRRDALIDAMREHFSLIHLQTLAHDTRDYQAKGFRVEPRYTYCVDLDDVERLWVRLDGATRRQVQKSRKGEGENISEGAAWEEIAHLTRLTFERQGGPSPIPDAFVREIVEAPEFAGRRMILAARNDAGDLVSTVVSMWDADRRNGHYVIAATRPDALQTGASSWLVWETIKRLTLKGVKAFDFCGANHDRVARFKEGFAPRLVTYYDIQWSKSKLASAARGIWKAWSTRETGLSLTQ